MRLTDEQKRTLDGARGEPARVAMEMLVALGEIYGAEDFIPIKSAHLAGLSLKSHGIAGMEWVEEMARKGAKFVVPTTMNVVGVDRSRDLGLPADWVDAQMRIQKGYEAMGAYGTSSCVPYYYSFLPRFGESIAWAESSAVVFTNSVLGARDNREGGPSAWASAITGVTPRHGFHLDENRKGDVLFKVKVKCESIADYGALGNYVGKMIGEKIPVFENLGTPTMEELVYFGSALASAGGVALFHAIGITPEAPDIKTVFAGKKYEVIELGKKELEQGYHNLTSGKNRKVNYVAIGCPHCSLNQVKEVAELLKGKKIHKDVLMWVHTNIPIKQMAVQFGYAKMIEDAGAVLTQDLCTILGNPESLDVTTLATNSPKMAFYAPGSNGFDVWYGKIEKCVEAAITGEWKD
ncbi:MAG: aconitase X [Lutisporaceae bacterium]|jgi:predicted aconitase